MIWPFKRVQYGPKAPVIHGNRAGFTVKLETDSIADVVSYLRQVRPQWFNFDDDEWSVSVYGRIGCEWFGYFDRVQSPREPRRRPVYSRYQPAAQIVSR